MRGRALKSKADSNIKEIIMPIEALKSENILGSCLLFNNCKF